MTKYYLRIEGVNLSNFVYDTQDVSTIRGGGLLLLDAVEDVEKELNEHAKSVNAITTGASSGLFEFDADNGENVRNKIETFLNNHDQLKHATFVVDVIEAEDDKEFPAKKEELIALNRWQQMQSPSLAVPSHTTNSNSDKIACWIDMVRPATQKYTDPETKKEVYLSKSVDVRRKHGREQKQKLYTDLPKHLRKFKESYEAPEFKKVEENSAWLSEKPIFTNDLNEISEGKDYGNLHNKIAVIYADGNDFGKFQRNFSKDELKKFDLLLKAYRSSFLLNLLDTMSKDNSWKNGDKYRIETLLWGGDEFMLVVPAWKGWETLNLFFKTSADWEFEDKKLTHSAGLVFCHHNAPIRRIKQLAHGLAEVCKNEKLFGTKGNYFAYQVLESFDHITGDVEAYLQKRSVSGDARSMILEGAKMGEIGGDNIAVLKADDDFARGKLHDIVKALRSGKQEEGATEEIEKIRKAAGEESRNALDNLKTLLHGNNSWLHIADLWDYIIEKEGL
jgi:hypothetical protein